MRDKTEPHTSVDQGVRVLYGRSTMDDGLNLEINVGVGTQDLSIRIDV